MYRPRTDLLGNLGGGDTDTVGVTVEHDTGTLALSALGGLNPLADTRAGPEGLEETSPSGVGLGTVVGAHDLLDGLASLISVIEGDCADIVVENVGLDDAVEDVTANEAEVTVDGGASTTDEVPDIRVVVGESGISVLEVGDGN